MKTKIGCFFLLCFVLMFLAFTISSSRRMFENRKVEMLPDDRRMTYILFPMDTSITLQRAIIINGTELYDNTPFEYYDGEDTFHIEREKMTLRPPEDESLLKTYIARLNEEILRWGDNTDWRSVYFRINSDIGQVHVTLQQKSRKNFYYIYEIEGALTAGKCFEISGL